MMNIERLMDIFIEYLDNSYELFKLSTDYKRNHGYCAYLDTAKTPEELKVKYAHDRFYESNSVVQALHEVTGYNWERLWIAAKATRKWYEKTRYERPIQETMLKQIERFLAEPMN